MQPILVCSDRDGTINLDENYYLGSQAGWKGQISFLPGVVEGIRLINSLPHSKFVIVTNQSGIALNAEKFKDLTEERLKEVNETIISLLKDKGCRVDATYSCPYVDAAYVEKAKKKGWTINPSYIRDGDPDLKPNTGMIEKAAKQFGFELSKLHRKFMIGDRKSDVVMGLNAGCISILISSYKTRELGDEEEVRDLMKEYPDKLFITKDFLEAARHICHICQRSTIMPSHPSTDTYK